MKMRNSSQSRKRGCKMRTIGVINQKGGVGKTTTTLNLSSAFARAGKKILIKKIL